MSDFSDEEMRRLFAGVKIRFGLRQQGHIPKVEAMLLEGKSWDEIGRQIGWAGSAVEQFYDMEKARASASLPGGGEKD